MRQISNSLKKYLVDITFIKPYRASYHYSNYNLTNIDMTHLLYR